MKYILKTEKEQIRNMRLNNNNAKKPRTLEAMA